MIRKKQGGSVLAQPRSSSRKGKLRPTDAAGLITAIETARLDQRTTPAKKIISLRTAIAAAPLEAAKGIIRDVLAVNLAISQAITSEIGKPGFEVLQADGSLNPLLSGHWENVQRNLLNAARLLLQVEPKPAPQSAARVASRAVSGDIDISALVLESADEAADDE